MFRCQSCQYESKRKFNLQIHVKNKHNRDATDQELARKPENMQMSSETMQNSSQTMQISSESMPNSSKSMQISSEIMQISPDFNEGNLVCPGCHKSLKNLQNLKKHRSVCKGVSNVLECHFCHTVLSSYQAKSKHIKVCKIRLAQEQVQQLLDTQNTNSIIHNNTNNSNNQQIINYYNTINNYRISNDNYKNKYDHNLDYEDVENINDFGKEDISYITDDQMRDFALNHNLVGFLIEKHFNPDHPENHNIRHNDSKSYMVLRNKVWVVEPKEVVHNEIYTCTVSQVNKAANSLLFPNFSEASKQNYIAITLQYKKYKCGPFCKTIDVRMDQFTKDRRLKMIALHNTTILDRSICM